MNTTNKKIITISLSILVVGALVFLYYQFNPAGEQSIFPACPSKSIFGFYCPGCGSQRAIHQILHGDWSMAMRYNPALVITLPLTFVLVAQWILRHFFNVIWRIRLFENNIFLYSLFFLFIIYMILRNIYIPAFEVLRPPG